MTKVDGDRAVAIIIRDNKILLIRRVKPDEEYYVFPGGRLEAGEPAEETMIREVQEEVSLTVTDYEFMFDIRNDVMGIQEHYFLVKDFSGAIALGGEEKEAMNEQNQYYPEWHPVSDIKNLPNLVPDHSRDAVADYLQI